MDEKKALYALAALAMSASVAACGAATTAGLAADTHHRAAHHRVHVAPSRARLERVVLRRSDVPHRYAARPHDRSGDKDSTHVQRRMARCLGVRNTAPDHVATANSRDFSDGSVIISSSVDSFRSRSDVRNDGAMIRDPKAARCFRRGILAEFAGGLPAGSSVRGVHVHIRRAGAGLPRNVIGEATGSLVLTVAGRTLRMHMVSSFVTGPFVEASVTTVGVVARVPAALQRRLTTRVARRAARI